MRNLNLVNHSDMVIQDDIDNDSTNLIFSQNLWLILPQSFYRKLNTLNKSQIINVYEDPYWWISTTQEDSSYIFKTFSPKKITTTSNRDEIEKFCEISSEHILSVIKLDFIGIPDDLDIFS